MRAREVRFRGAELFNLYSMMVVHDLSRCLSLLARTRGKNDDSSTPNSLDVSSASASVAPIVLSSRTKSTSKSVCGVLIIPLPAMSRGSLKTRMPSRGKPTGLEIVNDLVDQVRILKQTNCRSCHIGLHQTPNLLQWGIADSLEQCQRHGSCLLRLCCRRFSPLFCNPLLHSCTKPRCITVNHFNVAVLDDVPAPPKRSLTQNAAAALPLRAGRTDLVVDTPRIPDTHTGLAIDRSLNQSGIPFLPLPPSICSFRPAS